MKSKTLVLLAASAFFTISCGTTNTYQVMSKSNTETGGTAKFTQLKAEHSACDCPHPYQ